MLTIDVLEEAVVSPLCHHFIDEKTETESSSVPCQGKELLKGKINIVVLIINHTFALPILFFSSRNSTSQHIYVKKVFDPSYCIVLFNIEQEMRTQNYVFCLYDNLRSFLIRSFKVFTFKG